MNAAEAIATYIRLRQGDLVQLEAGRRQELICAELRDKLEGWSTADIGEVAGAAERLFPEGLAADDPAPAIPAAPEAEPTLEEIAAKLRACLDALPAEARPAAQREVAEQLQLPTAAGAVPVAGLLEAMSQLAAAAAADPDKGVPQGGRVTVEQQVVEQIARRLQGLKGRTISSSTAAGLIAALGVEVCLQNVLAHKLLEQLDRHVLDPVRGGFPSASKFNFQVLLERVLREEGEDHAVAEFRRGLRSYTGLPKALLNVYAEVVEEFRSRMIELEPNRFIIEKGRIFRSVDYEDAWKRFGEKYREFIDEAAEDWGERSKRDFFSKVSTFLGDYYGWD